VICVSGTVGRCKPAKTGLYGTGWIRHRVDTPQGLTRQRPASPSSRKGSRPLTCLQAIGSLRGA